jgi:hypothetical protein
MTERVHRRDANGIWPILFPTPWPPRGLTQVLSNV